MKLLVSTTEANRNFSKIALAADELVSDEQLLAISRRSFKRHEAAFKELAK